MSNPTPIPGLCTKCGKNPIAMENGGAKWCWQCLGIDPLTVPKEHGGKGVVIDAPAEDSNVVMLDFSKLTNKQKMQNVVGVDVLFVDKDGNRKLVRTTDSEQQSIAKRLIDNRTAGRRTFQFGDAMILPLGVAKKMEEVVQLSAVNDPKAQQLALALLAGAAEEGAVAPDAP